VLDADKKLILGLIWSIIVWFMLKELGAGGGKGGMKLLKTTTIDWAKSHLTDPKYGLEIKNLTTDFADGRAFLAILNSKGVSDYDPTDDVVDNRKKAFARAEEALGVPQLLDAEDPLCVSDEKSVLVYLSELQEKIPPKGEEDKVAAHQEKEKAVEDASKAKAEAAAKAKEDQRLRLESEAAAKAEAERAAKEAAQKETDEVARRLKERLDAENAAKAEQLEKLRQEREAAEAAVAAEEERLRLEAEAAAAAAAAEAEAEEEAARDGAATKLQAISRGKARKESLVHKKAAAIKLQAIGRAGQAKKEFAELEAAREQERKAVLAWAANWLKALRVPYEEPLTLDGFADGNAAAAIAEAAFKADLSPAVPAADSSPVAAAAEAWSALAKPTARWTGLLQLPELTEKDTGPNKDTLVMMNLNPALTAKQCATGSPPALLDALGLLKKKAGAPPIHLFAGLYLADHSPDLMKLLYDNVPADAVALTKDGDDDAVSPPRTRGWTVFPEDENTNTHKASRNPTLSPNGEAGPSALTFGACPESNDGCNAGEAFATQPVVELRNTEGGLMEDFIGKVTLVLAACSAVDEDDFVIIDAQDTSAGQLIGSSTVEVSAGKAVFSDLGVDSAGKYKLKASVANGVFETSTAFAVGASADGGTDADVNAHRITATDESGRKFAVTVKPSTKIYRVKDGLASKCSCRPSHMSLFVAGSEKPLDNDETVESIGSPSEVRLVQESERISSLQDLHAALSSSGLENIQVLKPRGAADPSTASSTPASDSRQRDLVYGDWLHAGPTKATVLLFATLSPTASGEVNASEGAAALQGLGLEGAFGERKAIGGLSGTAGFCLHLSAIRSYLLSDCASDGDPDGDDFKRKGALPVNVKLVVGYNWQLSDGASFWSSDEVFGLLEQHKKLLHGDVVVLEGGSCYTPLLDPAKAADDADDDDGGNVAKGQLEADTKKKLGEHESDKDGGHAPGERAVEDGEPSATLKEKSSPPKEQSKAPSAVGGFAASALCGSTKHAHRLTAVYAARGFASIDVSVRTTEAMSNFAQFAPMCSDPAMSLCMILASLVDPATGEVLVDGFYSGVRRVGREEQMMLATLATLASSGNKGIGEEGGDEEEMEDEQSAYDAMVLKSYGALPGFRPYSVVVHEDDSSDEEDQGGDGGRFLKTMWFQPGLSFARLAHSNQSDVSSASRLMNLLEAGEHQRSASATIRCTLAPEQDPADVLALIERHLHAKAKEVGFGARVRVSKRQGDPGWLSHVANPSLQALCTGLQSTVEGDETVCRVGSSTPIPIARAFSQLLPEAAVLVMPLAEARDSSRAATSKARNVYQTSTQTLETAHFASCLKGQVSSDRCTICGDG
jgi:hypothetical protein